MTRNTHHVPLTDGGQRRKAELVEYPDQAFRCIQCDWTGPAEEVDWGIWIPAGQERMRAEPQRSDCPKCGAEVEEA